MIASRRLTFNFALDRALEHCRAFSKPLLIFEPLRCDYPWASDRFHRFVLDGMACNIQACARHSISYFPYIEPCLGAGKGLLETLAADACAVVTDDFPAFFLPRMVSAAAKKLPVRVEAVDSNGILPLRATSQVFPTAYAFRRFLQKALSPHLLDAPSPDPLSNAKLPPAPALPKNLTRHWPPASLELLSGKSSSLSSLPLDHTVGEVEIRGGHTHASKQMNEFLENKLTEYAEKRNQPELDASSGLSPYLHFGHISVHEVFAQLVRREKWNPEKLALRGIGSREGWWNMSPAAESFLDELITWREVGYNFAAHRQDYDQYGALPDWAKKTLQDHAKDQRQYLYSTEQFESAVTHDPLWNAAQTQLVREGRMHNYLRMLWGKKILEWSSSPPEAARIMVHLNNKYALDGRDPNSYSGIFWVLGRYDRPWGPVRPVYGTIRYMSSENTARKVSVKHYIKKYSSVVQNQLGF
ncbi:MAG: deoxyribodipyrimidine photolyase [Candidatus Acidiferrum sp.]